jgi:H+-transporting ATPase
MYLKLSVAGHLTIFLTRTRGPFWSIRPARILLIAVFGTQTVATLIAVYGLFMTPLGWGYALFVWGYALTWFLVNDRVKLLAYRIFGSPKADATARVKAIDAKKAGAKADTTAEPAPDAKAEVKPDAKAEPAPEPKAEAKPEVKAVPKPEDKSKALPDLTPNLVERVHALYEELGRQDVIAVQEFEKAEEESKHEAPHS